MNREATADPATFLASTELFSGVGEAALQRVAAELRVVHIPARETVMGEGDSGDSLFLVSSGCLEVLLERPNGTQAASAEFRPGSYFGEIALLTGDRRSATIRAVTESVLLELPKTAFDALIEDHPDGLALVVDRLRRRIWLARLSSAMYRSKLFAALDSEVLKDLQAELEPITLASGQTLFHQDEEGDALFIVISGRLRVTRESDEGAVVLGEAAPGETVGEIALLGGRRRTATVSAVRETILAKLHKSGFERILCRHPAVAAPFFTRRMVALLRERAEQSRPNKTLRTIAVVAPNAGFDCGQFCSELAQALSATTRVLHLSADAVDRFLGRNSLAQSSAADPHYGKLVEFLNSREAEYDLVVYQADTNDTSWSGRCIGQADEILVVHHASDPPEPGPWEQSLYQEGAGHRQIRLVLVHRNAQPSGTARWLDQRRVTCHYHLQAGSRPDMERLARLLTGRAVALAISGGFARSLAALGVIRALDECGIPIDVIGGTSMGSIVAAFYSLGYSDAQMLEFARRRGPSIVRDWTLPIVSMASGRHMDKLSVFFRDTQIEDLSVPFFCVATNLTSAEVEVFRRGSLFKGVVASCRVPGVFPPTVWNGDLLVDGGVLNNMPADVAKDVSNGGRVIAVDVSPKVAFAQTGDYGAVVSGWRVLIDRWIFRKRRRIPGFLSVLSRSMMLNQFANEARMRQSADLYLRPPLERFRFDDFESGPAMADVAYHHARKALENFRWDEAKPSHRARLAAKA